MGADAHSNPGVDQAEARSQELHCSSPPWVTETQALGLSSAATLDALAEAVLKHRAVETETCTTEWDKGVPWGT